MASAAFPYPSYQSYPSYQMVPLPNGVQAPQVARDYLREHAVGLDPGRLGDALVLVSELVTNAISHGQPDITLCVRNDPPSVGVAVYDSGAAMPAVGARPAATRTARTVAACCSSTRSPTAGASRPVSHRRARPSGSNSAAVH